jgi:adenosylhomocysteine nucleosidase
MKMDNELKEKLRSILVVAAMDCEESQISNALGEFRTQEISKIFNVQTKIFSKSSEKSVILVKSGIGLANAAIAGSLIYETLSFDCILLLGVAGSITSDLDIGDLIVANEVIQHDSYFSSENGNELMAPGYPYVSLTRELRESPRFKVGEDYKNLICKNLFNTTNLKIKEGILLSGSEFVGSAIRKNELKSLHPDALGVEMEASALALVARKVGIPFIALKTIADKLKPDNTIADDYNMFLAKASENAGKIAELVLQDWLK